MLEVRLVQGAQLKKVLEAIRELVADANFDFSPSGLSLQAMDSTHVAVAALLRADAFYHFRCDRNRSVGMNLGYVTKLLRCAANDDILTLKADDGADTVTFMFESPSVRPVEFRTGQENWVGRQPNPVRWKKSGVRITWSTVNVDPKSREARELGVVFPVRLGRSIDGFSTTILGRRRCGAARFSEDFERG